MISLLFDIETDAIAATKIWGVSIYNMNTGKINSYYQDELTEGIKKLQEADKLIGHNIIGFDIPVIKELLNIDLFDKILVDTLVMSRLFNPIREGNHGLGAWGA